MSDRRTQEQEQWMLFLDPHRGCRRYNNLCLRCTRQCKQAHCVTVVECRRYQSRRGRKGNSGQR